MRLKGTAAHTCTSLKVQPLLSETLNRLPKNPLRFNETHEKMLPNAKKHFIFPLISLTRHRFSSGFCVFHKNYLTQESPQTNL